jgi:hypothetical protein
LVSLSLCTLLLTTPPTTETSLSSTQNDPVALSYEAFSQLVRIYSAGGETPDLVAKLNTALDLIQEAHVRFANGENASAVQLDNEAQSILSGVISEIPNAQLAAAHQTSTRFTIVVGLVPVIVSLTTLSFYVVLRIRRWDEKTRLYEMRIIEKEPED